MEQNLGLKPYTEEEKRKIEERLKKPPEGHSYGTYLLALIVVRMIYAMIISAIAPIPPSWLLPMVIVDGCFGVGVLLLFVLWIGDLIRHRKAKTG